MSVFAEEIDYPGRCDISGNALSILRLRDSHDESRPVFERQSAKKINHKGSSVNFSDSVPNETARISAWIRAPQHFVVEAQVHWSSGLGRTKRCRANALPRPQLVDPLAGRLKLL